MNTIYKSYFQIQSPGCITVRTTGSKHIPFGALVGLILLIAVVATVILKIRKFINKRRN